MNPTFEQLVAPILALKPRGEILLEAVPAPQKLAPHALAMTADVLEDAATGRFVRYMIQPDKKGGAETGDA